MDEHYCDICEIKRDPDQCFYLCEEECGYCLGHIECALDQGRQDLIELLLKSPSTILQFLKAKPNASTKSGKTVQELGIHEIIHPSHDHPLSLDDVVVNVKLSHRYCRCCRENLSGLAFLCKVCKDYCLHEECSKLPPALSQFSLHSHHPLVLKFKYSKRKKFVCSMCGGVNPGDCFNYQCQNYPEVVKSKVHQHNVKLVESFVVEGYDLEDQYTMMSARRRRLMKRRVKQKRRKLRKRRRLGKAEEKKAREVRQMKGKKNRKIELKLIFCKE